MNTESFRGLYITKEMLKRKLNSNKKKTPWRLRTIKKLRKEVERISVALKS